MRVHLSLFAPLASLLLATADEFAPLVHEHAGRLFAHANHKSNCVDRVLHSNTSAGRFEAVRGGMYSFTLLPMCVAFLTKDQVNTYLAYPPGRPKNSTDVAILYLTDIFGLPLINNLLLADSFAAAGYFVVEPDLFGGDAVGVDEMGSPGFNFTEWAGRHTPEAVDAIVASTIAAMREDFGVRKIGAVGYWYARPGPISHRN